MVKPKLTEITEVLLEQILELKKAVSENQKMHYVLIRKMDELDIKVNIDELKQFEIKRRRYVQEELIKVDEVYRNILEEKRELQNESKNKALLYVFSVSALLFVLAIAFFYFSLKE